MAFLSLLFSYVVYNVPFYILWLGGIVYAALNRQKHPRTSLFAEIGLGILLLERIISPLLSAYIQARLLSGSGQSVTELGTTLSMISFCSLPFEIAGWILLFIAAFGPRNFAERQAASDYADQDILL